MLPKSFKLDNLGGEFSALKKALDGGKNTAVFYATQTSRYHIATESDKFFLYVTPDRLSARSAAELLNDYADGEVVLIPEKDDILMNTRVSLSSVLQERVSALAKIYDREVVGAVISAEGLNQYFPSFSHFGDSVIRLKKGAELDRDTFVDKLVLGGYHKEDMVSNTGEFSLRGDICDVWADELPIRVEFFGDTIESIRQFAPDSMMSIKVLDKVAIAPKSDILVSQSGKERALKRLLAVKKNAGTRLSEIVGDIIERLTLNPSDPTLVWALPYIKEELSSIFDYLPSGALVVLDEVKAIDDKLRLNINAHNIRVKTFTEAGEATKDHLCSVLTREEVYCEINKKHILCYQQITSANPVFEPDAIFSIKSLAVTRYNLSYEALLNDIKTMLINDTNIYIYAGTEDTANTLKDFLFNSGYGSVVSCDGEDLHDIVIVPRRIGKGVSYPQAHKILIGTDEIVRRAEVKKKSSAKKKQNFILPAKGDYVVHDQHGIGLSEGIVSMDTRNGKRDYYVVLYRGGDKLYLPVDQMDTLEKYTGGGTPALHKLGGKEFERVKERVKNSIKALAIDLVSLYDKRNKIKGHKYQEDTVWQKELEDSFEYTETDDQLIATAEIKEDMEKGKIMDRLLCGDVGFGKTEVAIRAIFKTVMEGKQAAILSPTTILCQQHYNTIKARFNNFGIKIDVLSRFVSPEYIAGALQRIKSGATSVVVATHRLLSKDVEFCDLGLLVLDEEQRFGVEHKEKIKVLKNNVNVLALSATPIPRTLHMSLSGIRDISTLETAPTNRLPVETYVVEYTDTLLIDAVRRELARDGQVFILFNRVSGIETFYKHIVDILDDNAKVIYAHGQMASYELEEKIRAFYNKEANVLISTTIIENGIDLPDANTLIVLDSDRLGLSGLYQLRGRVGRSNTLAYAYFTVREGKVLTENAQRRLDALLSHTELGSGFKIAMEDLEIRGAGNILGREQHGNMEKVGYDMYCRLLKECVGELRGITEEVKREVEIVVGGDVTLPQGYITDGERRVKFYKNVAILASVSEQSELINEIKDVYGAVPQSVLNLIAVGVIKNLAAAIGVKRIIATADGLALHFYDNSLFQNQTLIEAVALYNRKCILTPSEPPSIIFQNKFKTDKDRLVALEKFLLVATDSK